MAHPDLWADLHGGFTHFPIALVLMAAACDAVAAFSWHSPESARLRDAGFYAISLAGIGSLPAVVSGLVLSKGATLGSGALRWHHLFVWPSFALIVAAAIWRVSVGKGLSRRSHRVYVALLIGAALLVSGAGYWGGELLKAFP